MRKKEALVLLLVRDNTPLLMYQGKRLIRHVYDQLLEVRGVLDIVVAVTDAKFKKSVLTCVPDAAVLVGVAAADVKQRELLLALGKTYTTAFSSIVCVDPVLPRLPIEKYQEFVDCSRKGSDTFLCRSLAIFDSEWQSLQVLELVDGVVGYTVGEAKKKPTLVRADLGQLLSARDLVQAEILEVTQA